MCGIAGMILQQRATIPQSTSRMLLNSLAHRGPDDKGWLAYACCKLERGRELPEDLEAQVFFAHRRLSILDLSAAGWQPMSSPDGQHHIILNGEIYNYIELRNELQKLGHDFHSHSDTEVLLAALQRWGAQCLARLNGMFAFAYLNAQTEQVMLARDPFGIKPLYYARLPNGI